MSPHSGLNKTKVLTNRDVFPGPARRGTTKTVGTGRDRPGCLISKQFRNNFGTVLQLTKSVTITHNIL